RGEDRLDPPGEDAGVPENPALPEEGRGSRPLGFLDEPVDPCDASPGSGKAGPWPDVTVPGLDTRRLDSKGDERVTPLGGVEREAEVGAEGRSVPDGVIGGQDRHHRSRVAALQW